MRKYRVVVHKILEDGTEIELVNVCEPGWYVSPMLKALARQTYEPQPHTTLVGQLALGEDDAA